MPEDKDILKTTAEDIEEQCEEQEHDYYDIEQLEREKAQLTQQLLRLRADFENFRRRSKNQMECLVLEANEELLQDLLPVLDNFERALNSQVNGDEEHNSFWQGMQMVYEGLLATLANFGLEMIVAEGSPFDPCYHDAISMDGDGGEELIVVKQIQTGYLLNGKVIRHTKVLVGQNKEEE